MAGAGTKSSGSSSSPSRLPTPPRPHRSPTSHMLVPSYPHTPPRSSTPTSAPTPEMNIQLPPSPLPLVSSAASPAPAALSPDPIPFDSSASGLLAARAHCAAACAAFNTIPEDAPPETRVRAWRNIVDPARVYSPVAEIVPSRASSASGHSRGGGGGSHAEDGGGGEDVVVTAESPLLGGGRFSGLRPLAPFVRPPVQMDYGLRVHVAPTAVIDRNCTILDTPVADVRIGEHVHVGPAVSIQAVTHPRDVWDGGRRASLGMGVVIEDCAWVGGGSIILPGVTIGKHAVIGPGSVVTSDIPPFHVAAGNPAQLVKRLPDADPCAVPQPEPVSSLAEALTIGTDPGEEGVVDETVQNILAWARSRRETWRREGGGGGGGYFQ